MNDTFIRRRSTGNESL